MIAPLFVLLALAQTASSTPSPAPQTPPAPSVATDVDPATLVFPVDAVGLVLVAIKPDHSADYEAVIVALHEALAVADPAARRVAEGWRVFKATETDAKGNALFVHVVATPLAGADYRPSVVLARLARELPPEVLVKYRDAFAGATTRLSLSLLADLALAPVTKPKP